MKNADVVAVKIIDIDESDSVTPRIADSLQQIMKEVGALQLLSETKEKNINHILAFLPVGKTMWMITEHCGGGSVHSLVSVRPGSLDGVQY